MGSKVCSICGRRFSADGTTRRYCSAACAAEAKRATKRRLRQRHSGSDVVALGVEAAPRASPPAPAAPPSGDGLFDDPLPAQVDHPADDPDPGNTDPLPVARRVGVVRAALALLDSGADEVTIRRDGSLVPAYRAAQVRARWYDESDDSVVSHTAGARWERVR
jgi:hypothetical protein